MFPEIPANSDWLRGIIAACEALGAARPERRNEYVPTGRERETRAVNIRVALLHREDGSKIYFHEWLRSDPDDLHDHHYDNVSVILDVGYWEITPSDRRWHGPGSVIFRKAEEPHRIEIDADKPRPKSLFITAKARRSYGYHTGGGWMPWYEYWNLPAVEWALAEIRTEEHALDAIPLGSVADLCAHRTAQLAVRARADFVHDVIERRRLGEQHG